MLRYVVKRVMLAIVSIIVISLITFFTMNAIPGGPFNGEKAISPTARKALEERFNLDKPVGEQYILYMGNMLQGDLGVSAKNGREITTVLTESFSISAKLGGMAAAAALAGGVILGSFAALMRNRLPDRIIIFFTTLASAVPNFVLATLLLLIFCIQLGWVDAWSATNTNYVLPIISLALYPLAYITRLTKTSMLDVLGQDYVRTAKAKGVLPGKVIFKHALRNAILPVITYMGPMIAYIICGSLVVESVFTIGGLGSKFVYSITNRDYPMIMGTTMFLAVIMVTMSLICDLIYKAVDPRIKLD